MSIDLAPTFVNIAGVKMPPEFDGMDLAPLLHPKNDYEAIYKRLQESEQGSSHSVLSYMWRRTHQVVMSFRQENSSLDSLSLASKKGSPPAAPFRTSVLLEYFGEEQDVVPECPELDHLEVYVSEQILSRFHSFIPQTPFWHPQKLLAGDKPDLWMPEAKYG